MITNLKVAVDRSGLKQKYLATLLGLDYGLFSKIVAGERPLSPDNAKRLAKIFKVAVGSLEGAVK